MKSCETSSAFGNLADDSSSDEERGEGEDENLEDMMSDRIFSVLKLNLIGYLIGNRKLNLRDEKESKILISS